MDIEQAAADRYQQDDLIALFPSGDGDTILLRIGDHWVLNDACFRRNIGTAEAFWAFVATHNVRRLRYVVISHFDADHIMSICEVITEFKKRLGGVGEIVYSDAIGAAMRPADGHEACTLIARKVVTLLAESSPETRLRRITPSGPNRPHTIDLYAPLLGGGVRWRCRFFWPHEQATLEDMCKGRAGQNASSLVAILDRPHLRDLAIILTGDIDRESQKRILAEARKCSAGRRIGEVLWLKVPHHGAESSLHPPMLEVLTQFGNGADVRHAFVSSRGDAHPHNAVLDALAGKGWTIWDTSRLSVPKGEAARRDLLPARRGRRTRTDALARQVLVCSWPANTPQPPIARR